MITKIHLALAVMVFGAVAIYIANKQYSVDTKRLGEVSFRLFGIIAVITVAAVIVLSEVEGIQPVIALLGTIAGYLLGYSERKGTV